MRNLSLRDLAFLAASANGAGPEPPPVGGYLVWLTAEAGAFQDVAGTTPAVLDGDRVLLWQDQSGNGYDAGAHDEIQAPFATFPPGPTLKLNAINGFPAMVFNVAWKQRLRSSVAIPLGTAGATIFTVARPQASGNAYGTLFGYDNAHFMYREQNQTNKIEAYHSSSGANPVFGSAWTDATDHIFGVRFNDSANTLRVYQDNSFVSAADAGAMTASGIYAVGGRQDDNVTSFWFGWIAEQIVYPSSLSDADFTLVHNHLQAKYGTP